jgi:hypothetical protein
VSLTLRAQSWYAQLSNLLASTQRFKGEYRFCCKCWPGWSSRERFGKRGGGQSERRRLSNLQICVEVKLARQMSFARRSGDRARVTAQPDSHAARAAAGTRSCDRADRRDDDQDQAVHRQIQQLGETQYPETQALLKVFWAGRITVLTYVLTFSK